jgi:hypothetical protein
MEDKIMDFSKYPL